MTSARQMGAVDYVIFALVLGVSAGIGIYYAFCGTKQKSTKEFLMASRSMGVFPVTLSLLASFMSAITLLGTPAEMYIFGTQYWLIAIAYLFTMPASAYLFLPIFYRLNLTSCYEYLELRFSKGVRLAGSLCFSIQMVLYMAIVLYAPSLALNAVTGFNVWAGVCSVGCVCIFYTTIGGIKAVMWTDVFQIFMMFAGLLAVVIKGCMDQGGLTAIWNIALEGQRIEFGNFDPDPRERHTVWGLAIGGLFTWTAIYGVNQAMVQRCLTCPSLRKGQLALWINLPILLFLLSLVCMCGLVIYAEYKDCDPLSIGTIQARDQLLPLYVMDRLSHVPGIAGIFMASIFSGALSTISSGLNSMAAVTLHDIIQNYWFPDLSEKRATLLTKIMAFGFGAIMMLLTVVASQLGGVLQAALGLFGMIGGPVLGVFTLGVMFPWANWKGALSGLITGLIIQFWIGIGANIHPHYIPRPPVSIAGCPVDNSTIFNTTVNGDSMTTFYNTSMLIASTTAAPVLRAEGLAGLYQMSYLWYSLFGVITVIVIGLIVSFATGHQDPEELDPILISPLFDIICCCLPLVIRKKLRCGVRHKGHPEANPLEMEYLSPVEMEKRKESLKDLAHYSDAIMDAQTGPITYKYPKKNSKHYIDVDNVENNV